MSTTDPATQKSNAGRYFFLLILGLVVGVIATVMALRALEARKDHFPGALMEVQGWHMGQLKSAMEQNRCSASDVVPHLQALRMTANDLEPAFPDLRDDERFKTAAAAMRGAVDKAINAPPLSCESLAGTMKAVGDTCKGCHRDFKN
ncbi:cytochrome c [Thermomonas sp.]|uniref:cytochrome c n=1 Tax=Thermomonas sp. TaxID=1971895 RepID=UPI0035B1FB07|nr:cytochrome c [Pseudomonadota bacterium]